MRDTDTQRAKAQQMLDAVRAGQTIFTHAATGWMVVGPAARITPWAIVTVTKSDGSTSQVQITHVQGAYEKQDVAYAVATFRDYHAPADTSGLPATDGQIAEIERLLGRRYRDGDGGGFTTMTDTSREALASMTRGDASTYITSLREQY